MPRLVRVEEGELKAFTAMGYAASIHPEMVEAEAIEQALRAYDQQQHGEPERSRWSQAVSLWLYRRIRREQDHG